MSLQRSMERSMILMVANQLPCNSVQGDQLPEINDTLNIQYEKEQAQVSLRIVFLHIYCISPQLLVMFFSISTVFSRV